jgi:hypothetical protein
MDVNNKQYKARYKQTAAMPYPCLYADYVGLNADGLVVDYGEKDVSSSASMDFKVTQTEDNFQITVQLCTDNEYLLSLIAENSVQCACEVSCSGTMLKQLVTGDGGLCLQFEINKKSIVGKVHVSVYMLANHAIEDYRNPKAHSDYAESGFAIEKGEKLGFFGRFDFDADIEYGKLKTADTFMRFKEVDRSSDYQQIDLTGERIMVELSREVFQIFTSPRVLRDKRFVSVIHSSIVQNALYHALCEYYLYAGEEADYSVEVPPYWARVVRYMIENGPESGKNGKYENAKSELLSDQPKVRNSAALKYSQIILSNPFKRMIEDLECMFDKEE